MPVSSNTLRQGLRQASLDTNICLACRSRRPSPSLRLVRSGSAVSQNRSFSVFNRPPPNYPGHVPLTHLERLGLTIGSAFGAYFDPNRHDLVASLGEATAQPAVRRLRDAMLRDPTGRRILRERPRITSAMLSPEKLSSLPPNSVGATYAAWLDREHVSPDTRAAVRYVDDEECAYVIQRYRESHDFYHALTGLPVFREGEVALKAWEFAALGLPMTGLSVFSVTSLPKKARDRFWSTYGPWAVRNGEEVGAKVMCVYWEEILDMDCGALREKLGVVPPPDLREVRRRAKEERQRERAAREAAQTQEKAER